MSAHVEKGAERGPNQQKRRLNAHVDTLMQDTACLGKLPTQ